MSENNIVKLLRVLAAPTQDLENVFQQLLLLCSIGTATGATLEAIGDLVGQERNGITDDDVYRRYARARIMTNRSVGVVENYITIARLVVDDSDAYFRIIPDGGAALTLRVEDIALSAEIAAILIGFLRQAVSGGVRITLESGSVDPAEWFRWGVVGKGFGSVADPSSGGKLISAVI